MQLITNVPDTLIDDLMANYPEASSGMSLVCVDYDYQDCAFEFWDSEVTKDTAEKSVVAAVIEEMTLRRSGFIKDAVVYKLTRPDLERGLKVMADLLAAGKLGGLGISNIADPAEWDQFGHDALVQCAIFGEVIYG